MRSTEERYSQQKPCRLRRSGDYPASPVATLNCLCNARLLESNHEGMMEREDFILQFVIVLHQCNLHPLIA